MISGKPHVIRWIPGEPPALEVLDQRLLPGAEEYRRVEDARAAAAAIRDMVVRGAPLIGITAAWGLVLAASQARRAGRDLSRALRAADRVLRAARPTAHDLSWALERLRAADPGGADPVSREQALITAARGVERIIYGACRKIGQHGEALIRDLWETRRRRIRILTHCNAGRLACGRYGTATAPLYAAHAHGLPVHVWVDETRPRNQGAALTAWELGRAGIPHTLVADNAGGHLMQQGLVDLVLVGADRITRRGDTANKIGTYLKALAAADNGIPFYVAAPCSTFDPLLEEGGGIPIEERAEEEVLYVEGWVRGQRERVRLAPEGTRAANPAFDVTPARLITGFITERGLLQPGGLGPLPDQEPG